MTRDRLLPWSGFVLGGVAWAIGQQWGTSRTQDACLQAWPWQTIVIEMAALALVLVGAGLSWRVRRASAIPTDGLIASVGLAADVVFALAILFQTLSALIIPRCFS